MVFTPKKMLVTGAAGFIGSNFVIAMLARYPELEIISFDKLTYAGNLDNLKEVAKNPQHHFIKGDILDRALVEQTLREYEIDTIVHFAAESHVDNSIKDPGAFVQTNVVGTYTLLEAARIFWLHEQKWDAQYCRFHHISTDEVYGTLGKHDPAFTEETAYAPNSPYSASKAGSDHLARAYFHTYGLPVTMSNCSNNYGPRQHPEKFIPTVIRSCLNEKPIPIYGDGTNIRDWLYVEDHCDAVDVILRKGKVGETYNVGGNNELDNLTLAKKLCVLLDEIKPRAKGKYADLLSFVKDRPGHDWRYAIDNSKIENDLEWQPKTPVADAFSNTIKWFVQAL
jgi:dTDP-glucose 4,6-dehydratase